jgi:predicted ATPase
MIRSLRLRNFKCFEDQTLELGALTLLSGLNGMGKSTILQSLLLLRQSYQQGLLTSNGLALNGNLARIGRARDALFEGAHEERIGFDLTLASGQEVIWWFGYNPEAEVMGLISPTILPATFVDSALFGDNFHYLEAERIGPRPAFEMSNYFVRQHRQLGTRGEYTAHFLSAFERENISDSRLAHEGEESLILRDQVEAWIGEVSPGTRIHLNSYAGLDLVSLEYSFATGKQVTSNNYRSTNVGFGITYTLPILVALLSSAAGTLILLENPEAHLHPKGQLRIGRLIALAASCGVQVLVETHSDHVLNGIRLAVHSGELNSEAVRLHFFERQEIEERTCHVVISPLIDRNGRIDVWPEGFFDELDKALELLMLPAGD